VQSRAEFNGHWAASNAVELDQERVTMVFISVPLNRGRFPEATGDVPNNSWATFRRAGSARCSHHVGEHDAASLRVRQRSFLVSAFQIPPAADTMLDN